MSNGAAGSARMVKMLNDLVAVVRNRPLTGGHFLLDLYSPRQAQATRAKGSSLPPARRLRSSGSSIKLSDAERA